MNLKVTTRIAGILSGILACSLSFSQEAQEEDYLHIADDLGQGLELQDVSDRAYEYSNRYWEYIHYHERDDHDHEEHGPGTLEYDSHDGIDEELSAGEAVTAIYTHATELANVDRLALDIVNVACHATQTKRG